MSPAILEAYRGQNDLVTLLPSGALTAQPDVYETVWGRAFLDEAGGEIPALDPGAFGALLAESGETSLWQANYACLTAATEAGARDLLEPTGVADEASAEAEALLLDLTDLPGPAEARALDAVAAIRVLRCLGDQDLGDRIGPVVDLIGSTAQARLALEVQLHDALGPRLSADLVSGAPVPAEATRECAGVDAYAAAAAVELGRATFDEVAACLAPYATFLADTQVLHRLASTDGPDDWRNALIAANLPDVLARMQPDGIVRGRSNDSGSVSSTLTALRLLRLAGEPEEPLPAWVGEGLAVELERLGTGAFEGDLVRHACVLAEAVCGEPAQHRDRVRAVLEAPGPADARREAYARMAYELGLEVDLAGEVDAAVALTDRGLVCVAAAFELADPGSTGDSDPEIAWQVLIGHLEAGDVVGASCASWIWRVAAGGHGDDRDEEIRRAVTARFHQGEDGLWRSELSPAGDLALSYYLDDVIGLA